MNHSRTTTSLRALLPIGALILFAIPASPAGAEAMVKSEPASGAAGTSVTVTGSYSQSAPAPLEDVIHECVAQTYQWDKDKPFTFTTTAGADAGKCSGGEFHHDFHPPTRATIGMHTVTVTLDFRDGTKQSGKTTFEVTSCCPVGESGGSTPSQT